MKLIVSLLIFIWLLIPSSTALAQNIGIKRQTGPARGFVVTPGQNHLETLISNVISLFFTIGGLGFVIMILWGAVGWILSGGDKEKIAGARKRITTAIIGLVLLSLTFVIMLIAGQVLGISALSSGNFSFKGLLTP